MEKYKMTPVFPEKEFILDTIKDSFLSANIENEEFFRFEFEIKGHNSFDLLSWLNAQKSIVKIYFSDRNKNESAGIGIGDIINYKPVTLKIGETGSTCKPVLEDVMNLIKERIELSGKKVKYFGGHAFDVRDRMDSIWYRMGNILFISPLIEITGNGSRKTLAINFYYHPEKGISKNNLYEIIKKEILNLNRFEAISDKKVFTLKSRQDVPGKERWLRNIDSVKDTFQIENISKIVLARKTVFNINNIIDPLIIFNHLKKQNVKTYDFYFQTGENYAFFGCSPELLFFREKKKLISDAIAGTIQKGKNKEEEKTYADELMSSKKDSEEFRFVFNDIKKELKKICESVNVSKEKELLVLSYAQHIRSQFDCTLKDNISDYRILKSLHPTPAVSGYPLKNIYKLIKRYENFYRGFYSGPVGWISKDEACFAVGLRSAILDRRFISVFAGAGIVKKSSPEMEWDEVENKITPFLRIFNKKSK
ncbi:MAG: isochorismate synthase [Actinomycetota bacterium]|jgi:menaquinone-specific isochorismate synthase|nr:isochorismate synthase [Actinomycetota bacterium]